MPIKDFDINYNDIELKDYYKNIQWEKDLDLKIDLIAKEVLAYGFNGKKADISLEEMIYFSKFQFIEGAFETRLLYRIKLEDEQKVDNVEVPLDLINPNNNHEEYKEKEKMFIKNPIFVLKQYAIEEANKEIDENNEEEVKWKDHCSKMVKTLTDLDATYKEKEKSAKVRATTFLISKNRYYGETKTFGDILNKNNGGFFERLFNTTSNEYKNFKNAFKAYNDEKNPNFGNKKALKDAAFAYIKHKCPNAKEDEGINYNLLENVKGTSLKRVELCYSVLKELSDQEANEAYDKEISNLESKNQLDEKEQQKFQNDLEKTEEKVINNDLIDDDSKNLIEDNEISNE